MPDTCSSAEQKALRAEQRSQRNQRAEFPLCLETLYCPWVVMKIVSVKACGDMQEVNENQ